MPANSFSRMGFKSTESAEFQKISVNSGKKLISDFWPASLDSTKRGSIMNARIFITGLALSFVVNSHASYNPECKAFFRDSASGEVKVVTLPPSTTVSIANFQFSVMPDEAQYKMSIRSAKTAQILAEGHGPAPKGPMLDELFVGIKGKFGIFCR